MVATRTGTANWQRIRRRVLHEAQSQGLTHCPGYEGRPCGRELDYSGNGPKHDGTATVDHITPYVYGGTDEPENLRILCSWCNTSRGAGRAPKPAVDPVEHFTIDTDWLDLVLPVNA